VMARLLDTTTYFPHYWRNMSEAETLTRRRALAAVTVLFVAGVVAGCSSSQADRPTDRSTCSIVAGHPNTGRNSHSGCDNCASRRTNADPDTRGKRKSK
jgi:hypothetical protein